MSLFWRVCLVGLLFLALTGCVSSARATAVSISLALTSTPQAPGATIATRIPISATSQAGTFTLQGFSTPLAVHSAPVTKGAWSPDGRLLAVTAGDWDSPDPTIRLCRVDGGWVKVLTGHTGPVISLAWSPDGHLLASGSLDTTIRLWQADGTPVTTLRSPDQVVALAWSPDGQILASASAPTLNPIVRLWRRDGNPLGTLSTQYTGGKFYNLAWSPNGKFLLGGAIDYKVWRTDGTEMFHLEECSGCTPAWGAAWSPDSTLWAVGNESGVVAVYDVEGHETAQMQNEQGNADALAWSPDGQTLAGGDGVNLWQADGTLKASHASFGRVDAMTWSPDGRLLASVSKGSGLRVWDAEGKLLGTSQGNLVGVAWFAGDQLLAAESVGDSINLWRFKLSLLVH